MSLVNLTINNYCPEHGQGDLQILKTQINYLMSKVEELQEKINGITQQMTDLQTSVDTEQAQVQAELDRLNGIITDMQNQQGDGATPAQLQNFIDQLSTVSTNITTAKDDLASTMPDAQEPGL